VSEVLAAFEEAARLRPTARLTLRHSGDLSRGRSAHKRGKVVLSRQRSRGPPWILPKCIGTVLRHQRWARYARCQRAICSSRGLYAPAVDRRHCPNRHRAGTAACRSVRRVRDIGALRRPLQGAAIRSSGEEEVANCLPHDRGHSRSGDRSLRVATRPTAATTLSNGAADDPLAPPTSWIRDRSAERSHRRTFVGLIAIRSPGTRSIADGRHGGERRPGWSSRFALSLRGPGGVHAGDVIAPLRGDQSGPSVTTPPSATPPNVLGRHRFKPSVRQEPHLPHEPGCLPGIALIDQLAGTQLTSASIDVSGGAVDVRPSHDGRRCGWNAGKRVLCRALQPV